MFTLFLVLIAIVCFLLIIVIMVQNPKGGGLSSAIGGTQQLGGVQKTTDFLDKSTWTLASILILLILFSSLSFPSDPSREVVVPEMPATESTTTVPATTAPVTPPAATPAPAQ